MTQDYHNDPHYRHATLVKAFRRCERKVWWTIVAGVVVPSTGAQSKGTEIHRQCEVALKTGEVPSNRRAADMLRLIRKPYPRPTLLAEHRFTFPITVRGVALQWGGSIDVVDLGDTSEPIGWDFKSLANVVKYAQVEYQLEQDPQLMAYGHYILTYLAPTAKLIKLGHLYVQTEGSTKSQAVSINVTREHVDEQWQAILRDLDTLQGLTEVKDPEAVPHNPNACMDFGGCPHRARCGSLMFAGATPENAPVLEGDWWKDTDLINPPDTTRRPEGAPYATPINVATESLPEVLRKELAKGNQLMNPLDALAALAGGQTAVTTVPSSNDKTAAFLASLQGQAQAPAPSAPAEDDVIDDEEDPEYEAEEVAPAPAPSPPAGGMPGLQPGHVWALDSKGVPYQRRADMPVAPAPSPAQLAVVPAAPVAPPAPSAEAPAPRRPGRPKGSKSVNVAPIADVQRAPETAVSAPPPVQIVNPTPIATEAKPSGVPAAPVMPGMKPLGFLFINCFPVAGFAIPAVSFASWVAPITERIRKETGADWRFQEYRKGPAMLNQLALQTPLPMALIVDSDIPEAKELWAFLAANAQVVFQGSR